MCPSYVPLKSRSAIPAIPAIPTLDGRLLLLLLFHGLAVPLLTCWLTECPTWQAGQIDNELVATLLLADYSLVAHTHVWYERGIVTVNLAHI